MKKQILILFLLLSSFSFAQEVKVEVDTTNIRIGEQFYYKISVSDTANVIIPKLQNLKGLEVVEDVKIDTFKNNLIKKYLLTSFDSGAYYIPSQQIFIRNRAHITDSILINVATVAIDTTKQKMFPIKAIQSEPYTFDDFKPYLIWVILGILLIAGLVYYLKTRKKNEAEEVEYVPVLAAYEEAIGKLKELDEKLLWQNNKVKQYYSELTEILRNYLGRDIEIPTLELTSSEIVELVSTQNKSKEIGLAKETISNIDTLLKNADLVKFAKSKPMAHEIESDRKSAEQIINNIRPKVKEYRKAIEEETGTVEIQESTVTQKPVGVSDSKEEKKSPWKKIDRRKVITTAVTVTLVVLAANFVPRMVGSFLTASTQELAEGKWMTKTYGLPSITIETPVELKKEPDPELPEEVKNSIVSMSGFGYSKWGNKLDIIVFTSSYAPTIQTSLDGAVGGAIEKMKSQPEVSNVTSNVEQYDAVGIPGAKLSGTYSEKGVDKKYEAVIMAKDNRLWTVIVAHQQGDENGEKIAERILNSIKIDDAYVE
ncbi:hypothetical protein AAON49_00580 [Pseudotenacibaculum sp. MALMAid0570]|uniref:hypothetical protein n=1 Tax=Pseudotenacibaculum sp. MALMAid0570 TaxID=3143938 RepID=UPI0032DF1847